MGTQLVLSFAKRSFLNLCNALNSKPNSQTIRALSPYRNISLFSLVFILINFTFGDLFRYKADHISFSATEIWIFHQKGVTFEC